MTMGEMVEALYKRTQKAEYKNVGTISGNGSVSISSKISSYKNLNASDMLIVITSGGSSRTGESGYKFAQVDGFAPRLSYDATNGIITLSGMTQAVRYMDVNGSTTKASTQTMTANIYVNVSK